MKLLGNITTVRYGLSGPHKVTVIVDGLDAEGLWNNFTDAHITFFESPPARSEIIVEHIYKEKPR